jgi:hypothetical protein
MRLPALLLRRVGVILGLLLILTNAAQAFAQSGVATADLSGVITDSAGAVVPGITVTLRNVETNIERTVTTDEDGRYKFAAVPPATYELVATGQGFAKTVTTDVVLTVGQAAELDLTLQAAVGGEEITVTAGAELIETQRTSVANTVNQNSINNLPINGRNFLNFSLTSSTLVRDNAPSIGPAPTAGLNAGGQRARSNNISIDGADNNDNSVNAVRGTVSQEAVQEFQVITNSYAPEFGRASGAVVNIITKSGTNELHGSAFGYLRHRSFQARNAFSISDDPAFTRGQYGFTLGGPIKEDRTFFFFALEQTRRQETAFSTIGRDTSIFNITPAQQAFIGNPNVLDAFGLTDAFLNTLGLSQAVLGGTQIPLVLTLLRGNDQSGIASVYIQSTQVAQYGFNFALGAPVFPASATPQFPNGTPLPPGYVPLGGIDPATGFPLNGEFPISEKTTQGSIRVDHQVNSHNNASFRYNFVPSDQTGLQSNAQNQVFGQNAFSRTARSQTRDHTFVASNITTWDAGYVNEARFQYAYRKVNFLPQANSVGVNINGVGFFGREPFAPVIRTEKRVQFQDNFSILKGNHNLKFGGDINIIPAKATFELNFGGIYSFGSLPSALFFVPGAPGAAPLGLITQGLAAALIGQGVPPEQAAGIARAVGFQIVNSTPGVSAVQAYGTGAAQTFVQGFNDPNNTFKNTQFSVYAQDSWRVRPNLTFNYGVRYDVERPPIFEPFNEQARMAEDALGVLEGIPHDNNNFQPRVAIAWDPWNDGKTAIKAAYGIFFDHPLLALGFNSNVADGFQAPQLIMQAGLPLIQLFRGTSPIPGAESAEQRFDDQQYPGQQGLLPFTLPVTKDFVYGYSQQANLTIEREILKDVSVSGSYLWVRGLHLNRPHDINTGNIELLIRNRDRAVAAGLVPPGTLPILVNPGIEFNAATQTTVLNPVVFQAAVNAGVVPIQLFNFFRLTGPNFAFGEVLGLSSAQLTAIAAQLGLPQGFGFDVPYGPVIAQESTGTSDYHALTLGMTKRFSHNNQFFASYTWSHAIDDSTDLQTLLAPANNDRLDLERGNSSFDQRHRFVFSGVFVSPYRWGDDGIWKKVLADFTFAPILELAAGRPFNILTGVDTNFDSSSSTDRPNVLGPGEQAPPGVPTFASEFGTFYLPAFGTNGNLGRNTGVRPGYASLDVRLARKVSINENVTLDLIGECFNVFNRVNIIDVNNNYTAAGVPTAAADPRQFQFGVRISF